MNLCDRNSPLSHPSAPFAVLDFVGSLEDGANLTSREGGPMVGEGAQKSVRNHVIAINDKGTRTDPVLLKEFLENLNTERDLFGHFFYNDSRRLAPGNEYASRNHRFSPQ